MPNDYFLEHLLKSTFTLKVYTKFKKRDEKHLLSTWFHQDKLLFLYSENTFHFWLSFSLNTIIGSFFIHIQVQGRKEHSLNTESNTGYITSCTEMTVLLFPEVYSCTCMHTCTHVSLSHTKQQQPVTFTPSSVLCLRNLSRPALSHFLQFLTCILMLLGHIL